MKIVKNIFTLIVLSVIVTSCTDLELEEQNPIENTQYTGDSDDDDIEEKEKDDDV